MNWFARLFAGSIIAALETEITSLKTRNRNLQNEISQERLDRDSAMLVKDKVENNLKSLQQRFDEQSELLRQNERAVTTLLEEVSLLNAKLAPYEGGDKAIVKRAAARRNTTKTNKDDSKAD